MHDTDAPVLICLPAIQNPNPPIPGSVTLPCLQCGRPYVVAPSGQRALAGGEAVGPVCTGCAPSEAFDVATIARSLDRPGVRDEVLGVFHRRGDPDAP